MNEFKCKCCGECCSNFLPLSIKEIDRLKDLVKKRKLKPNKRIFEEHYLLSCPFLDESSKCIIYEDRPLICSEFRCDFKMNDNEELIKENRFLVDLRKEIFKS